MTGKKLINNGATSYFVLVPEKRDVFIDFAIKTLVDSIEKSTGVRLDVSSVEDGRPFISLGSTEAKKIAGLKECYGRDGYRAVEKDGNLYLFGQSEYGAIWAVYGLLEEKVGYKFYTPDEIKIENRLEIDIEGLDLCYTPTMPNRCSGFGLAKYDLEYATGLKAYAWYGQRLDGKSFWGAWAHNHISEFITPIKYYKDHPEWFYQDEKFRETDPEKIRPVKSELCLSNMEMREEFFKLLIERIQQEKHATHFLLGHEDNGLFCDCENCKKIIAEIGTSGLYMDFVNDMARRVEDWRRANAPEREISIGSFAYGLDTSFPPPVKEVNGEFVPVDPCVVAEPNVFIMFAPIATIDHNKAITEEINRSICGIIDKWKSICSRYAVWLYYGSFRRSFEFVDGIYRFKEDVRFFKDLGVECFYVESPSLPGAISFQAMTLWLLTQLEWNKELDTDDLIKEFCENYYKVASPQILRYFHLMMDYCKKTRDRIDYLTGERYAYGVSSLDTIPQGYWDLNIVYDASLILDEADKVIDEADYGEELKTKLHDRVEIERMTLLHIQLEYFNRETSAYDEARSVNTYSKEKIFELCDRMERDVKRFGFSRINGDGTAIETIEGWRNRAEKASRGWRERTLCMNKEFYSFYDKREG